MSPCAGTCHPLPALAASRPPEQAPGHRALLPHPIGCRQGGSKQGSPCGVRKERSCRQQGKQWLQMGTCGCMSASRAPPPGSPCWRLSGFSVLCPSPPRTACRIQGLCKCPPLCIFPQHRCSWGTWARGAAEAVLNRCSPSAHPHPSRARAASDRGRLHTSAGGFAAQSPLKGTAW